jgi:hypothetical protein
MIISVKFILGHRFNLRNSIIQMIVSVIFDEESGFDGRLESFCSAG